MGLRVWAPETAFPGLLVISGLLFAAVLPPCQAPDENKHFLRAYHVSEGHLVPEVTEPGWLGGNLPESVTRISETSKYLRFHSNVKVNPDVLRSLASDRLEPERRRPTSFEGAEANLFVGYIPQAMAIALGRLVGLNPIGLFYVARLANLTLAAFALSLALRLAPTGRLVFSMVALLPVTVQQVASVSPDASIISGAFLLTALLLRASLVGVPAGWSLVARVAGLTAWLAVCKFTLAPLTLLCLGVPRKVLGSWFHYLAGAAVIGPAVLLAASLLIVGRAQAPPGPREDLPGRPAAPAEQASSPAGPAHFPRGVGNSWVQVPYLDHLFTLGWLDTGDPPAPRLSLRRDADLRGLGEPVARPAAAPASGRHCRRRGLSAGHLPGLLLVGDASRRQGHPGRAGTVFHPISATRLAAIVEPVPVDAHRPGAAAEARHGGRCGGVCSGPGDDGGPLLLPATLDVVACGRFRGPRGIGWFCRLARRSGTGNARWPGIICITGDRVVAASFSSILGRRVMTDPRVPWDARRCGLGRRERWTAPYRASAGGKWRGASMPTLVIYGPNTEGNVASESGSTTRRKRAKRSSVRNCGQASQFVKTSPKEMIDGVSELAMTWNVAPHPLCAASHP